MMPKNLKAIGDRLRKERKRLGFKSQDAMAVAMKMPARTYWDRESGNVAPDALFFATFRELGGNVSYVLDGQDSFLVAAEQDSPAYTPSQHLAQFISTLKLSAEDAETLKKLAERLTIK